MKWFLFIASRIKFTYTRRRLCRHPCKERWFGRGIRPAKISPNQVVSTEAMTLTVVHFDVIITFGYAKGPASGARSVFGTSDLSWRKGGSCSRQGISAKVVEQVVSNCSVGVDSSWLKNVLKHERLNGFVVHIYVP